MAIQARTEFASALNQVCSERGLEPAVVIDSIKQAILAAYRKDYSEPEGIEVHLNEETGEVLLSKNKKNMTPPGFGRIAAQTAKQVILQRIREAEKNAILDEYSSKIETIVSGMIQRISGPVITVNLGKAEGIMPPQEQAQEKYFVNQRLKFFVVGIKEGTRGEEIIVSRSANGLLEGLFKQEVPEVNSGTVDIKKTAREAGSRSKMAVFSDQMGVDPVGSCVGQKGVRVQAVINELGDEKIDVIAYQEEPVEFIRAALSPAKDLQVKVNEKEKTAEVTAPDDQLSLAIGKEGQNVRLAAKLTGYKIDIRGKSGTPKEVEAKEKAAQEEAKKALGVEEKVLKLQKVSDGSQVSQEKGTAEKKEGKGQEMAQTSKLTQSSKSKTKDNQSVPKPPADDEEPLIADKEEKKEEKEAQRVAEEIKTETPDLEQQGKEKNIRSADSPSTSDDSK
ncbi:transcription termination factor NusA [Candidatus Curtissbacteria bacterium RIFCSPLOWO2_01_FULL_39_62]|uniref:Transcription termination/antitermination protein NusA n=2 Tax=Candidatus Curtissiibacteriota TaxID=1752717 RepID=A0A1F5GA38_9BACT|nr:MAG: transcription termination factor NusA [Candidatus Curtissbacteria bacterium RIFCSPHIGHO2_01_FULL_39_57]OGD88741.1 MAG: transcription termination factor NusA [Candidatus Curtissbacteria bacterium RIFCSPHIGHO2_02_FULL_40_16b]OGD90285.1 MAG: transcription termination factor NusA [Candidatus Curtissbacteria bacterium RIFCSPHIGHO2_12_FULL_38_37]OGD99179.1 MAG: transcription termination factor NusA [Candidatus Curtissbacteria bacterium RIFCSPLOWO2_02_FULL_40_11]OGE00644.1 MAG: transcription t